MRLRIHYLRRGKMRRAAFIVIALSLLACLGPAPHKASTDDQYALNGNALTAARVSDDVGTITTDLNDSDEFFQNAIRSRARKPDYSHKIESLLKQMTVEEKVGQMTQLTLEMIVSGHDQTIQLDPSKLQKAIGKYGVGSILNVYNQALTPDKWQDLI